MLKVAFAFNFNIQRCEIEVGEEEIIVRQGYMPLIETLLKHGMKADLFISGYSSKKLLQIAPDLVEEIKNNLGQSFDLGTYTYTHPIPQLLSRREFERQLARGLEIDREVFAVSPRGFLPPEFAYTGEMGQLLRHRGIEWVIALASQIKQSNPAVTEGELYLPHSLSLPGDEALTIVPAAYQLPGTPARFFKLMMKGELEVDTVIQGVRRFAESHPDSLLLFKRDAETIFIDAFNSGFNGTREVFESFIAGLSRLELVESITVEGMLSRRPPGKVISLNDYLGNTKLETFTEGQAKPIWDLTVKVRDRLLKAEQEHPDSEETRKAWECLLLSHNSDGRIGYWFSQWNPGEHQVAPSRRRFVEDNLKKALDYLGGRS